MPGYFPMHDDMQGMRVLQMTKCFEDGQFPCRWVPDMGYGYGYPQFNFYPPLPYYIMTGIHLAGLSILGSVKIGFILTFFLSALGMYLLGKKMWGKTGGVVSALFYLFLPYRAVNVYVRGAMGEIWAMAFFPFIFWSLEQYFDTRKRKYLLFLTISLFGLATSHLLSVIMLIPFLALWVIWRLWQNKQDLGMLITGLSVSGLLAVGLSSFYTLPAFFEKPYAHFETLIGGYFGFEAHFVGLSQMLWNTYWDYGSSIHGPNDEISFLVGLLQWTIPLVSLLIGWKFRTKLANKYTGLIILVLAGFGYLFLIHPRSIFIWKWFDFLKWLQFPWRFLSLAGFVFSLAGGSIALWNKKVSLVSFTVLFVPLVMFNLSYFQPESWLEINDADHFADWDKLQTISIFDYLPIAADHPPTSPAPDVPWLVSGSGNVISYEKGTDWQKGEIIVNEAGALRLPLFDFPGMSVTLNNRSAEINSDNELGLITINVPEGRNKLHVRLVNTPIRTFGNLLSIICFFVLIAVVVKPRLFDNFLYDKK